LLKSEFIIQRQGRSFVLYAGLLDLAHAQGLRAIRTRLLQIPADDNGQTAICSAEVETERGTFSGIGDASPANVARAMLTCTIRLAETRAKARALRDAVNVGVAAFEELGDETDEVGPKSAPGCATMAVQAPGVSVTTPIALARPADPAATPSQRALLARLAGQLHRTVDVERLTKAQASALISVMQQEVKAS